MPTGGKSVKFHENGRVYFWVPASRTVYTACDTIIDRDCYNLEQARKAVRKFQAR